MEQQERLIFDVWRDACRHIEIEQSLARVVDLLRDALPVDQCALYLVDAKTARVERLCAIGLPAMAESPGVDARTVEALAAWCKAGRTAWSTRHSAPATIFEGLFAGMGPNALALPLSSEQGTLGVLLLANTAAPFNEEEIHFAGLLREPLAVALETDRRLHELSTLREAAEADKRKLLRRLGREHLTDEIIGAQGGLQAVMERVWLVTRSDVPVLILGETGSGKEVIARAIHDGSSRAEGPFIRVNCGAIPTELIDSELFGHERGSFTGAVGDRKGWFERADGGTLFLVEIGELPAAAQVRFLRVLQDSSFERVGGEKALHVNVRIVAATHRDLARMVQEGGFREDLWYRIAVFPIVLPPLRERKQDIPALAGHFAERAARRFGLKYQAPTQDDIGLLTAYRWPGNVRELASVLDRAAILGDGRCLEVVKALGVAPAGASGPTPELLSLPGSEGRFPTLDEAMRAHVERALSACHGKIEGAGSASALLGINPHTLRARMRKLGIDWRAWRR
jgi:transcriptional regulator with GAF, ATPase, and Fis domain